jgi:hypothetical protein
MKVQEFLEHHGIAGNPFAEEDAQNDTVFKRTCLETTFHPAWDKIFGDAAEPSSNITATMPTIPKPARLSCSTTTSTRFSTGL